MKKNIILMALCAIAVGFSSCGLFNSNKNEKEPELYTSHFTPKPFTIKHVDGVQKTVLFSEGNLQYNPSKKEWRFAPNQTHYIGSDNARISDSYKGWIDLFNWKTGTCPTAIDDETNQAQRDWGTNAIGNSAANTWRTLETGDWYTLLLLRPDADKLRGFGLVGSVAGLILLPDEWVLPSGLTFTPGKTTNAAKNNFSQNYYTLEEWAEMEKAGAVFLPAAGCRLLKTVADVGSRGCYWASNYTEAGSDYGLIPYFLNFDAGELDYSKWVLYPNYGRSVRLVKDLPETTY